PACEPGIVVGGRSGGPGVPPQQAEAAALAELQRLADEPVGPEELEKVHKQARAQWVYAADGVSRQAVLLGSTEIVANMEYLAQFMDRLAAVTPPDMQQAAGRLFADRNRTVGWYLPEDGQPTVAVDA